VRALRPILLCIAVLAASAGVAGAARADTYCVNTTGCDATHNRSDFQQALTDAKNRPGFDTVRLGSDPLTTPTGFHYETSFVGNTVAIVGAGGRNSGQSRSSLSLSGSPSGQTVLKVLSPGVSTISGIDVVVPSGSGNSGIDTDGTISDVAVEAASPASGNPSGVTLEDGGALTGSDVSMPTNLPGAVGVFAVGAGTLVDGSTIRAAGGLQTSTGPGSASVSGAVRRSEVVSSAFGVEVDAGDFVVEDTLLRNATDNTAAHAGVVLSAPSSDATLALDHVTMIGAAATGTALSSSASASHSAALSLRNSLLSGYGATFSRTAPGAAEANITTDYSDYSAAAAIDTGPGAIIETNHVLADPGFASATDFHLRSDSPLIDAGDPAGLALGESQTDASGQPRILDGGGDCVARRDIGAFEFQPGPRPPVAVATASPDQPVTGQSITFDASGSCDPDGDSLTYSWSFDEGAPGDGVSGERAFSRRGLHSATVTVTDSTGRSTMASVTVRVGAPERPTFAGVAIPPQTVRVSKKGLAKVRLRCPADTVGACSGKLTISRAADRNMGSVAFAIARGGTRGVTVKLTKRARTALLKAKRLNATARSSAHDTNRTTKGTSGTIKLVAPR
jgi:hypothetical protein